MNFYVNHDQNPLNRRRAILPLVFLLFSLVYGAFSGTLMATAHADASVQPMLSLHSEHAEHNTHHDGINNFNATACDSGTEVGCGESHADIDCNASSHCNPVGTLCLEAGVFLSFTQNRFGNFLPQYNSIDSFPPYTPPIASHV